MATVEWDRILQTDAIQRMAELIRREFNLLVGFVGADGRHMWIGTAQSTDKPLCDAFMIRNASQTCIGNYKDWIHDISPANPVSLFMQCHAGMQGIIAPIVLNGECVGAFIASGFVFAEAEHADACIAERGERLQIHASALTHGCRELVRLTHRESQILRNILEETSYLACHFIEHCMPDAPHGSNTRFWTASNAPFESFIGRSHDMQVIVNHACRLSASPIPALITGAPGTGKTKLAQTIRNAGSRQAAPNVIADCAGIPADDIESELFGLKRGATVNAFIDKPGLLDVADRGTLLIKNIDALPASAQNRLAMFIETGAFLPVGSVAMRRADVRIMATSSRDLQNAVTAGTFLQSLFERLNIVPMHIPALADHPEDIPDLSRYFLAAKCRSNRRPNKTLSDDAIAVLSRYSWPGNVRELENEIERIAVITGDKPIVEADDIALRIRLASEENAGGASAENSDNHQAGTVCLPAANRNIPVPAASRCNDKLAITAAEYSDHAHSDESLPNITRETPNITQDDRPESALPDAPISPQALLRRYAALSDMMDAVEREIIVAALSLNDGNRTQTAKYLKISRRHLVRKLEAFGIQTNKPHPR